MKSQRYTAAYHVLLALYKQPVLAAREMLYMDMHRNVDSQPNGQQHLDPGMGEALRPEARLEIERPAVSESELPPPSKSVRRIDRSESLYLLSNPDPALPYFMVILNWTFSLNISNSLRAQGHATALPFDKSSTHFRSLLILVAINCFLEAGLARTIIPCLPSAALAGEARRKAMINPGLDLLHKLFKELCSKTVGLVKLETAPPVQPGTQRIYWTCVCRPAYMYSLLANTRLRSVAELCSTITSNSNLAH